MQVKFKSDYIHSNSDQATQWQKQNQRVIYFTKIFYINNSKNYIKNLRPSN